jgi:hypothetical protein
VLRYVPIQTGTVIYMTNFAGGRGTEAWGPSTPSSRSHDKWTSVKEKPIGYLICDQVVEVSQLRLPPLPQGRKVLASR